jgi:phosphate-selective porin OprO/OprP
VQELDQKIRILERDREIDQEAASEAAKTAPKLSLGADGFSFSSADSNFVAQLHGVVQFDNRTFINDGGINGNSGFLLRRARPIFSGTVYNDFSYFFQPELGGSTVQILDAYANYHYSDGLQLEVGKFKPPVGLEPLQSDTTLLFNERSLVSALLPYRDLGVQLHGDLAEGRVNWAAAIVNGAPDWNTTTTNQSFQSFVGVDARVFFQPWKNSNVDALRGIGFGVGGSYQPNHPNTSSSSGLTPGYNTDGQQKFFTYNSGVYADGAEWRISPQAYYYYGPLGVMGEYAINDQHASASGSAPVEFQHKAWELSGSWLLTGEDASYNGVQPLHPFNPVSGDWGAWQIVGRFAQLDLDNSIFTADGNNVFANSTKSASGAQAWSVGLNWYLNRDIRANLSYSRTVFSGYTGASPASPPVVAAQPESVIFSRVQLAF